MATVEIDVTQSDIAHGERGNCRWCPVALAVRRACPDLAVAVITGTEACFGRTTADRPIKVPLPLDVRRWIGLFDAGEVMMPKAFKLEVPDILVVEHV